MPATCRHSPKPSLDTLPCYAPPKARASSRRTERYTSAAPPSVSAAAWPKAAWYVEGQGRWGVGEVSECPLKVAFVPLGQFIEEVG